MGLYNFQKRFVPFVLSGEKTHTIRARRRYPDQPGDICHLYTGLRVKGKTRLLMRAPCVKVEEIEITGAESNPTVIVDGHKLSRDERERLACCDGFMNFEEMAAFWKGRLPFLGDIIHWEPKRTVK